MRPAGVLDQRGDRFAAVRCKRRDVDQACDARIVTGLGDHGPAVGLPHENDGTVLFGDDAPGRGHVVGKRGGRILHDTHPKAILLQDPVDVAPAGTVDESAVNQDDRSKSAVRVSRHDDLRVVMFRSQSRRYPPEPMATFYAGCI